MSSSKFDISALINSPTPSTEVSSSLPSFQSLLTSTASQECDIPTPSSSNTYLTVPESVASPIPSLVSSLPSPRPSEACTANCSKPKRKRATGAQLQMLNDVFQRTYFPSTELRLKLAAKLNMPHRSVQIWFQNQRQLLRQRADDKTTVLIDGRKRKDTPNDTFVLDGEEDKPEDVESLGSAPLPKKPRNATVETSAGGQERAEISSAPSTFDLYSRSLHSCSPSGATEPRYQSPRPLTPSAMMPWWSEGPANCQLPPLPNLYPHYSPSPSPAPTVSLRHFVTSPSNEGIKKSALCDGSVILGSPHNFQQPLNNQMLRLASPEITRPR